MTKRVVLITGALAGIGRATAFAFAKEGDNIVISGRRKEAGEALAKELQTLGIEAEFILADVRNEADVKSLIDQCVKRFGRLDVAVNNAGTEGKMAPLIEETSDNYHLTFDTNVLGTFLCLKYELQTMMQQGSGCIINLSSVVGFKGFAGASVYCATKHAVEGLTKAAALEAAPANVRVNAVAPGPIATDMVDRFTGTDENKAALVSTIPLKRLGNADEVAQTIVFLASDKAGFINGQSVGIDGGMRA